MFPFAQPLVLDSAKLPLPGVWLYHNGSLALAVWYITDHFHKLLTFLQTILQIWLNTFVSSVHNNKHITVAYLNLQQISHLAT